MARTKDPNLSRHIIERTIETSVEKGMAKATSIEIAKGSGVTEATVFSHFGSIANLRKKAYLYAEDVFKTHFERHTFMLKTFSKHILQSWHQIAPTAICKFFAFAFWTHLLNCTSTHNIFMLTNCLIQLPSRTINALKQAKTLNISKKHLQAYLNKKAMTNFCCGGNQNVFCSNILRFA